MSKKPSQIIKENPFLLAPMDNVTDLPFRELCENYGCGYSTTELCSVEAIKRDAIHQERYQKGNLKYNCVQLFGSSPESFVEAAKKVNCEADAIDVNFGCPSPNVTRNESGSMLLNDPPVVGNIIEKLVKNTDLPITAKIRLGYKSRTYKDIAREIEDAGADLLTVHGRTASQGYSGTADWNAISQIKENTTLPVVGNGDVTSEEDIDEKLESKSDALMIGRGAIGDPSIFSRLQHYHSTGDKLPLPDKEKKKKIFIEYLHLCRKHGMDSPKRIRQQAMWFVKGIPGARELRKKLSSINTIDEVIEEVKNL